MSGTAILVFARMDSTRLPGKVLADMGGRALLGRVLDRVRRVSNDMTLIVATSDREIDDPIADFASSEGVKLFRGDGEDVAGRAIACCDEHGLSSFVRISGDSPFIPPELIDRVQEVGDEEEADLVTNVHPRSWPAGASVELVTVDAMKRAYPKMTSDEREHVTAAFYAHPADWRISNVAAPEGAYRDIRLTVDTAKELDIARKITGLLGDRPETAKLDEVVAAYRDVTGKVKASAL